MNNTCNQYYNKFSKSYKDINYEYKPENLSKKWDVKLSLDSFNKTNGSDPYKGVYKFQINSLGPRTYGNNIGSNISMENITDIRIDQFRIPIPFLKKSVKEVADDNTGINPNISFLNDGIPPPQPFIIENSLVNSDYNQNTTTLNGSDYLQSYASRITNGRVYIGIRELRNYGGFNQNGNVYHFEFIPTFSAQPYPSLLLTPADNYDMFTLKNPAHELTTITIELFTMDDELKMPLDIIQCTTQIDSTNSDSLYLTPNKTVSEITSFGENLRGSSVVLENFTLNYKDSTGNIYDTNGNVLRTNTVTLKSPYTTYESYVNTNGMYIDIDTSTSKIIPLPTPSSLNDSGQATYINYTEDSMGNLTLYNNTTKSWSESEFNSKSIICNLKLIANRLIIPIRIMGLISRSS